MIPAGFECCLQHHRRSAVVVITARIYTTEVTPLKEIYRRELRSKRQPDLSDVCFVAGTGELAHKVRCHKKTTDHCALSLQFAEVIPAGFEPTTHSLEGCCSIQLSYGTIVLKCWVAALDAQK